MPRVILDRIVHFEYNYGKTLIDDLTWRSDGQNMLNFMPNGGGKSVVNQMMSAMFLFGKDRDYIVNENNSSVTRKFSSFFKRGARPTYLIKEMVKDNGAGRMLLVMCVRKSDPQSEDKQPEISNEEEEGSLPADSDNLSITVWLYESEDPGDELSAQIPLKDKTGRVWTEEQTASWFTARKKLGAKVERFNLSSGSAGKRNYREALRRNGISLEEKKLMRPYAMQESGLSSFVGQNSTEEALMDQYIVPAAAQRLEEIAGSEENQIRGIRKAIRTYCENHEQNEEDLQRYQDCYEFQQFYNSLQNSAQDLQSHQRTVERYQGDLHNAAWRMSASEKKTAGSIAEWNGLIEQIEEELHQLRLASASLAYYQAGQNAVRCKEIYENRQKEQQVCEKKEQQLSSLLENIRYTRLLEEARRYESRAAELATRIEAAKSSVEALQKKIDEAGGALYAAYSVYLADLKKQLSALEEKLKESQAALQEQKGRRRQLESREKECTRQLSDMSAVLKQYDRYEASLAAKGILIPGRLEPFQIESDILLQIQQAEKEKDAGEQKCIKTEKQIRKLEKQRSFYQNEERSLRKTLGVKQQEAFQSENRKQTLEAVRQNWQKIARKLADPDEVQEHFWDNAWLKENLEKRMDAGEENLAQYREREQEILRQRNQLTKESADLDEDVLRVLEKCRITPLRASSYLRDNRTIHLREAKKLCLNHPLLPFSLLMSAKEREMFLNQLKIEKIVTSAPVIVTDRERFAAMSNTASISPDYGDYTIYAGFDGDVLDPRQLKARIAELDQKAETCRQTIKNLEQSQFEYRQDLGWLKNNADQNRAAYERALREWQSLQEQLAETERKLEITLEEQDHKEEEIAQTRSDLEQAKEADRQNKQRLELLKQWHERYAEAAEAYHQKLSLDEEEKEISTQLEDVKNSEETLQQSILEQTQQQSDLRRTVNEDMKKASVYNRYKETAPKTLPEESIEILESRYRGLRVDPAFAQLDQLVREESEASMQAVQKRQEADERQQASGQSLEELPASAMVNELQKEKELRLARKQARKAVAQAIGAQKDWQSAQEKEKELLENIRSDFHSEPAAMDTIDTSLDYQQEIRARSHQIDDARQALEGEEIIRERQLKMMASIAGYGGDPDKGDGNEGAGRTQWSQISLDSYLPRVRQIAEQKKKEEKVLDSRTAELQSRIQEQSAVYEREGSSVYPEFLQNLKELGNLLSDSLDNFVYNHERGREIIAQRLAEVQSAKDRDSEMKERTVGLILSYIRRIDEEIRKIDNSTIVELNGRRESLMRIERTKLKEDSFYMPQADEFLKEILRRRKECTDPKKINSICSSISAADLFRTVYHTVSTKISVIKPEQNRAVYRYHRWNDIAASQSGAERLFASSVPLCAILYYQRNGAIMRRSQDQKWTTLYLDNLFGAIQAEFIIDPLFRLFEATNTQIVTFTYVKDYAVIKNFQNIKLMKTVSHKGGREILALEDKSGMAIEPAEVYGEDIRVVAAENPSGVEEKPDEE